MALGERLERVRAALERIRASAPPPGDDVTRRLSRASDLLAVLESLTHDVNVSVECGEWDAADALLGRVTLELYDEVVRELRDVDRHARGLIERSEALFVEAADFAGRRWRRAERMALKRSGG